MPNHVTNNIHLKGDKDIIRELLEAVKSDEFSLGSVDFNKIIPMPESLNITSGSQTDKGLKAYKDFVRVYTLEYTREGLDLLNIPEASEEKFLSIRTDIDREDFALGKQAFQNIQLYGFPTWYEWRISNWGTKWNAYGYDGGTDLSAAEQDGELWFQTAWGAPHPVIAKLAEMYPDVSFTHEWADEDIGNNCGRKVFINGECEELYYPDTDKEAIEFACKVQGCESPLDVGLMLNATGEKYIPVWNCEYEAVHFCDMPCLFANERLTQADIPQGLFCYYLRSNDDGEGFATLERDVKVNLGGTIVTAEPIDFPEQGYIEINDDNYPHFLGQDMSFEQYINGDFEDFSEGMVEPKL